nr:uncharacterized protein LOC127341976 isoform X2 [Lolium perenne]
MRQAPLQEFICPAEVVHIALRSEHVQLHFQDDVQFQGMYDLWQAVNGVTSTRGNNISSPCPWTSCEAIPGIHPVAAMDCRSSPRMERESTDSINLMESLPAPSGMKHAAVSRALQRDARMRLLL